MLKEFREFATKGNLVDIAVGFVMGAAFKSVATSFTNGIVSPLIGLLFNTDFKDLKYILEEGTVDETGKLVGEVAIMYGQFLTNVIDFILIAFVMFMVVKAVNRLNRKKEEEKPVEPKGPTQEELLKDIRDLLAKKQ